MCITGRNKRAPLCIIQLITSLISVRFIILISPGDMERKYLAETVIRRDADAECCIRRRDLNRCSLPESRREYLHVGSTFASLRTRLSGRQPQSRSLRCTKKSSNNRLQRQLAGDVDQDYLSETLLSQGCESGAYMEVFTACLIQVIQVHVGL